MSELQARGQSSSSATGPDYRDLELDAKVELHPVGSPLALMHRRDARPTKWALAGARYARKERLDRRAVVTAAIRGRWASRGRRVPIRVPRIRRVAGGEIPLRSYAALHGEGAVNDRLLTRVLYGISCRNYAASGGGDSRGDRAVGVDRVPDVHPGQCRETARVPRARPLQ